MSSLEVRPGEHIAIVGPSGAGKTSLVNLIPRFYDPTEGTVEIDGHDLRGVTIASLRRQIGLVPQEAILFAGTVAENIAYGRPGAPRAEVERPPGSRARTRSSRRCPRGYDTTLGEGGMQLSGGQRQRLALARAVLNDPAVYILDEATSALDSESEEAIQEAMARLTEHRTTFIVAHRLSTVRSADRIVVIMDGRIVEIGPPRRAGGPRRRVQPPRARPAHRSAVGRAPSPAPHAHDRRGRASSPRPGTGRRCSRGASTRIVAQDLDAAQYEVLIADDASTDETPDVIAEAAHRARCAIRTVRMPSRSGVPATRNAAIRQARGRDHRVRRRRLAGASAVSRRPPGRAHRATPRGSSAAGR